MRGRVIFDAANNGFHNMAFDEALMLSAKQDTAVVRFYAFQPKCLSLGRFQDYGKTVNEKFCSENNIDVVRRPTGGRAVLHSFEITYSVVARANGYDGLKLKNTVYSNVADAWAQTLNFIGVPGINIENSGKGGYFKKPSCFSVSSKSEVRVGNKKITGAAQVVSNDTVLQHGFLLLNIDKNAMENSVNAELNADSAVTGVFDILPKSGLTSDELQRLFIRFLAAGFNAEFVRDYFTDKETRAADSLINWKYSTENWTKYKFLDNQHIINKILDASLAPVAQ